MVFTILIQALIASVAANPVVAGLEKRQGVAVLPDGSTTLAQRATFFCPPGIDATLALNQAGFEAGLRFCSNLDRWSPATLFSSQVLANVGPGQIRTAAIRCAATCVNQCETFSVAASTPGNTTHFGCNLYNATVPFRGNTNGGLFYARQPIAGALCPAAAAVPAGNTNNNIVTRTTTVVQTVTSVVAPGATFVNAVTSFVNGARPTTIIFAAPVAIQSVGPAAVIINGQPGSVVVTSITNNIVVVVTVIITPSGTTTTSAAPAPTGSVSPVNTFQCPADIVANYADTQNPGTSYALRFCSNTQRWSPADLFNSTQIAGVSYATAAQTCSVRCSSAGNNAAGQPLCATFSVAPTTPGGSTFGCNLYNAVTVFNGPTNGGLFYQRVAAAFVNPAQPDQCIGSLPRVTGATGGTSTMYNRIFCSRTERWSPATLFDSSVQTGSGSPSSVEAIQKCANRCATFVQCLTFSTTYTSANPPIADTGLPVQYNCNLYNAITRVNGATNGGAFYQIAQVANSTMVRRSF